MNKACVFYLRNHFVINKISRSIYKSTFLNNPRGGSLKKDVELNEPTIINQKSIDSQKASLLDDTNDFEIINQKTRAQFEVNKSIERSDTDMQDPFSLIDFTKIPTQIEFEKLDSVLRGELSLPKRQAALKSIMKEAKSEFYFYHLIENYGKDFSVGNLLSFVGCLAKMKRDNRLIFDIPLEIQKILDKQIIKYGPHFEAHNCAFAFNFMNKLELNLNNYSMLALIQLLKYHVNNLDLQVILSVKENLEETKLRSNKLEFKNKDFVHELCSTLDKALGYAVQLKQNDIKAVRTTKCFIEMLKYFHNDLSLINFQSAIGKFMDTIKLQKNEAIIEFCEVLAKKKYKHVNYLERVCKEIVIRTDTFDYGSFIKNEEFPSLNEPNEFFIYRILNSFLMLDFYDKNLTESLLAKLINIFKSLPNEFNFSTKHIETLNALFDYLSHNRHKSNEFIDFFYDDLFVRFGNKMENNLNYNDVVYYSALVESKKPTQEILEKFTDHSKSIKLNNNDIIRLLKGLLMYKQRDLAQNVISRLDFENINDFDDRMFLRDNFEIDTIGDSSIQSPYGSIKKFNNYLSNVAELTNLFNYEAKETYFSIGELYIKETDQKWSIVPNMTKSRFSNSYDFNGEFNFKIVELKNKFDVQNIWVVNVLAMVKYSEDSSSFIFNEINQLKNRNFYKSY